MEQKMAYTNKYVDMCKADNKMIIFVATKDTARSVYDKYYKQGVEITMIQGDVDQVRDKVHV